MGVSAIAILISGSPTLSQESDSKPEETEKPSPLEVRLVPPAPPEAIGSCFENLPTKINTLGEDLRQSNNKLPKEQQLTEEKIREKTSLQSERVELYYYRNADNMVDLLSKLPLGEGCVTPLPLNSFQAGRGVGRGGGNVMSLYGTQDYINDAKRFITSLDLPLPGINLQLWGAQISSKDPDKLAKTTSKVRWRISETQQLLRETFDKVQGLSVTTQRFGLKKRQFKENKELGKIRIDEKFREIANNLGYDVADGRSLLEVFLLGNSVDKTELFYQTLYDDYLVAGKLEDGRFKADDKDLQPYFDALKNDIDRPPFERFFRSRGLEAKCMYPSRYEELKQKNEKTELKCEQWKWSDEKVEANGKKMSLVTITRDFERKILLEFGLNYADFLANPQDFDPEELQRTAGNLNELLQTESNLLQEDIENLFLKPTLAMIQQEVGKNKKVDFAQVGRSTISTLDGVETQVSSSSISGFQISQSQDLGQLLTRAEELQGQLSNFLPTGALGDASEAAEAAATGGIPVSRLLGLAIASLEQNATPLEIETGTSLAFTPGISRNLNSAELNIDLTVVDPKIAPTSDDANLPPVSRIGQQELHTTVYTQALDFFDLSTFTSQATLDGGEFTIPIIGHVWNAVFGTVPVFGDLFKFPRGNQNVLHESILLTNSLITPTPLSFGNLYAPNDANPKFNKDDDHSNKNTGYCEQVKNLGNYLGSLKTDSWSNLIVEVSSFRITENLDDRCPNLIEMIREEKERKSNSRKLQF